MIEISRGARFLLESAQLLLVAVSRNEHLQRNVAADARVARQENAAHAAASELAHDCIATGIDRLRRFCRMVLAVARRRPLARHAGVRSVHPDLPRERLWGVAEGSQDAAAS